MTAFRLVDIDMTHVWRAGELGAASVQTISTGYAALSHALPGAAGPAAQ